MRPGRARPRAFLKLLAAAFVAAILVCANAAGALASTLTRADMTRLFPPPFRVGQRDAKLPIWPIFMQSYNGDVLVAYAFESIDFEPIPGFSGTPIDLLVAIKPSGEFLNVRVLSQHEPVFVDGLGPEPLHDFVKHYKGASLRRAIKVVAPGTHAPHVDSVATEIDGVAKATASIRIINATIINSALQVARARLGFAKGRDPAHVARAKPNVFQKLTFAQMLKRGFVRHLHLSNADVEKAFAGSDGAGLDKKAISDPNGTFVDVYMAEVDVPIVGRNLLGDAQWRKMMNQLNGAQAMLVMTKGRWTFMPPSYVPGATPDFIALSQDGAPVDWRDFPLVDNLVVPDFDAAGLGGGDVTVLRIAPQAAFDPATPSELSIKVLREKGQIYPERIARDFKLDYSLPQKLFILPPSEESSQVVTIWQGRERDIAIICAALLILAVALARQETLTRSPRAFKIFRLAFLAFTLVFIGWIAQAQLSIVWLFGLIKAIKGDGSFVFFLWDPPTLIVTLFGLAALFVWGRGTFCGWLCPFGALQEFAGEIARVLHLRQIRLPPRYERLARVPKFLVLGVILVTAFFFTAYAEQVAEVEPFKTSITLVFVRSAPFVIYAVALIVAGMFHYKFFCRYMCPLGASLAAMSFVRRWKWIPRRKECGTPCQMCRVKCRYGAIERSGEIVYSECFQCMDCVMILDKPDLCVPVVLEEKRARRAQRRQMEAAP